MEKEKLVELLQEKRKLSHELSIYFGKAGDDKSAGEYLNQACIYVELILLIENEEFFNDMYNKYIGSKR